MNECLLEAQENRGEVTPVCESIVRDWSQGCLKSAFDRLSEAAQKQEKDPLEIKMRKQCSSKVDEVER